MQIQEIMEEHTLNEGQSKLLELLKKFDKLCSEYGIVYYLGGGTALGAIRHKGFIPWDDDVDLYIPRDQFEKLLSVKDEFFSDDFVLLCHETYPRYRNVLVRCVDTNSTAVTKARIADNGPKGQFVELFLLDPMPVEKKEKFEWLKKHWIYTELMATAFIAANDLLYDWMDFDLYKEYRARADRIGDEAVLKELEEELFCIKEEDAVEYCARWSKRNLFYDIEWFGKPRRVQFEDTVLPVASHAERVLRFDYGDSWMYIPMVNEQRSHNIASDFKVPYTALVGKEKTDKEYEKLGKQYVARKKAAINHYKKRKKTADVMRALKETAVQLSVEDLDLTELQKHEEEKNYKQIEKYYEDWYLHQFSAVFWTPAKYIDIGDDNLYYALLSILMKGEHSKVRRVIEFREKNGVELSERLKKIKSFAIGIQNAYIALDVSDFGALENCLNDLNTSGMTENQYDYDYLRLLCGIRDGDAEKFGAMEEKIQSMLPAYGDKGELTAIKGDIRFLQGDYEAAKELYLEAYENTRHGFIREHIKKNLIDITGMQ